MTRMPAHTHSFVYDNQDPCKVQVEAPQSKALRTRKLSEGPWHTGQVLRATPGQQSFKSVARLAYSHHFAPWERRSPKF
jgi:hypothetical protein